MSNRPVLIFGGVDGTSIENDQDYEVTFRNSNVHQLYRTWSHGPADYKRGPNALDTRPDISTEHQARAIKDFVVSQWGPYRRGPVHGKAVFLAGYSRGAAAVIEVCKWLKDYAIPVECLLLYDPVDRSFGVGDVFNNTPIADNVRNVIHVVRDPAARSRESFGNCGSKRENWTKTKGPGPIPFFGTHAAMGGTLWPDPPGGGFIDEGFPDYMTAVTAEKDKDTFERVRSYTYGEFRRLIQECLQRMAREGTKVPDFQVTPVSGGSLPPTGGSKRYHIVRSGEWLSKIAQQYYGDPMKYTVIHKANLSVIGPNPDIIEPNQKLEIPYI